MRQLLTAALGWLIRFLFTAALPFVLVVTLAIASGLVRTALFGAFLLLAAAVGIDRATTAAGHAAPLPRLPHLVEVS